MIHFGQIVVFDAILMKPSILDGESLEEYTALEESLYAEFKPTSSLECHDVDAMVRAEWSMRRARRMMEAITSVSTGSSEDMKRLKLMERYYKGHEKSFAMAKRALEDTRKHDRTMEKLKARAAAATKSRDRQWEQVLKKMPTLTDWVN